MAYLGQIMPSFEQVLFLKHDNMASLFLMENMAESICLTTSPELAKQMQGLGMAVLGFQIEKDEMLQASYVVLGLEQVTYDDFLRVFQRFHGTFLKQRDARSVNLEWMIWTHCMHYMNNHM